MSGYSQSYESVSYSDNVVAAGGGASTAYTIKSTITPIGIIIKNGSSNGYNYDVVFNLVITISGYNGPNTTFQNLIISFSGGGTSSVQLNANVAITNGTQTFNNLQTNTNQYASYNPSPTTNPYTTGQTYPELLTDMGYTTLDANIGVQGYSSPNGSENAATNNSRVYNIKKANTLPITLTSFSILQSVSSNILRWVTSSEINNKYFVVQKSQDATNFDSIGITNGAGNSNKTINYNYTDKAPYSGTNYYRLKQVDYDGKFTYSDIESVYNSYSASSSNSIVIYPNPGVGTINFKGDYSSFNTIKMTSILGQIVFVGKITSNSLQLPSSISKGVYFVQLSNSLTNKIISLKYILH